MIIIACSMIKQELEQAMEKLGIDEEVIFVEAALHNDLNLLKTELTEQMEAIKDKPGKKVLFFGTKCHPEIVAMAKEYGVELCPENNCLHMILGDEMHKLDAECPTFYLTAGWVRDWYKMFVDMLHFDKTDIRQAFGRYERILLLESGVGETDEEEIYSIYEQTDVPIDTYDVTLDYFDQRVKDMLKE